MKVPTPPEIWLSRKQEKHEKKKEKRKEKRRFFDLFCSILCLVPCLHVSMHPCVMCLGTDLVLSLSYHIICLYYEMSSGARFTRIVVLMNNKRGVWGRAELKNDGTKNSRWQNKKKGGQGQGNVGIRCVIELFSFSGI